MFEDIEIRNKAINSPDRIDKPSKPAGYAGFESSEIKNIRRETTKPDTSPRPAPKEFEGRMVKLHEKGKKRGRRYSIIGITLSVAISAVVIYVGYYLLAELKATVNKLDKGEQANEQKITQFEDPKNICVGDYCCLASLKKITKNNFEIIELAEECNINEEIKFLDCEGSLKWCEKRTNFDLFFEQPDQDAEISQTATSNDEILGIVDRQIDSDKDGLYDYEEEIYGTDIYSPDTDSDGFSDAVEVEGGYNPLGEGRFY